MISSATIKLSPSALNLFRECPRCFWLEKVKNVKRPRGIFPSLPGGMDREIKNHFDKFRARKVLPPEMGGPEFKGIELFADQEKLERWRSWRTGLIYDDTEVSAQLSGALDDLLVREGRYIPFDYKTKGSPTTEEDAVKYYSNQLDCYALMLEANEMPTAGFAYLLYYSPSCISENGACQFQVQPIRVATDVERSRKTFRDAVVLMRRLQCQPCYSGRCKNREELACLKKISVDEVWDALMRQLSMTGSREKSPFAAVARDIPRPI